MCIYNEASQKMLLILLLIEVKMWNSIYDMCFPAGCTLIQLVECFKENIRSQFPIVDLLTTTLGSFILEDYDFDLFSIDIFYEYVMSTIKEYWIKEIQDLYPDNISMQLNALSELTNYLVEVDNLFKLIRERILDETK